MTYFPNQTPEQPHQPVFTVPVQDAPDDEDYLDTAEGEYLPMTYEEEQAQARRDRWRVIAGVGDFFGVLAGILVILLLVALLISLVNWVLADMTQSFTLLQAWL